jgi:hypothetical protein
VASAVGVATLAAPSVVRVGVVEARAGGGVGRTTGVFEGIVSPASRAIMRNVPAARPTAGAGAEEPGRALRAGLVLDVDVPVRHAGEDHATVGAEHARGRRHVEVAGGRRRVAHDAGDQLHRDALGVHGRHREPRPGQRAQRRAVRTGEADLARAVHGVLEARAQHGARVRDPRGGREAAGLHAQRIRFGGDGSPTEQTTTAKAAATRVQSCLVIMT